MTLHEGQKILKKRVRDVQGNPIGMVIALNKDQLGYSVCNGKWDVYDDKEAFKIAYSRAKSQKETDFNFWLERRIRHLKDNPIRFEDTSNGMNRDAVEGLITYILANKDKNVVQRELLVLAELKLMQERANRYFKEEK